jgi:LAO/AO transport system kinase
MVRLGQSEHAFIRPSPSAGAAGGTHPRTGEAVSLCEAAGFDRVIVETVGVGQIESEVADLVDLLLLVVLPNAGDDVQAAKRGVLDVCDLLVVSRADSQVAEVERTRGTYADAFARLNGRGPGVHAVSALRGDGVEALAREIESRWATLKASERLESRRRDQLRMRFRRALGARFEAWLNDDAALRRECRRLEGLVERGERLPQAAAEELVAGLRYGSN